METEVTSLVGQEAQDHASLAPEQPAAPSAASPGSPQSDASSSSAAAAALHASVSPVHMKQALEAAGASPAALLAPLRALVEACGGGLTLQEAVAALQSLAAEAEAASSPAPDAADSTAAAAVAAAGSSPTGSSGSSGGGEAKAAATAAAAAAATGPKPTPAQLFGRAARSSHLSYAELLNAFAASASGLDSESLADYLYNLQVLCSEAPDDELVLRPVISMPTSDSLPPHLQHAVAAAAPGPQRPLTSQAVWQQIIGGGQQQQQQHHLAGMSPRGQYHPHQSLLARGGRSISDPVALQQALEEAQAFQQQQQAAAAAAALRQAAGSPLGSSSGLLGRSSGGGSSTVAAAQAAVARLQPGSPPGGLGLGRSSMGDVAPPQRAISAPASELWAYAAELAAEVGSLGSSPAMQQQQQQQQWQRQQAAAVAAGQQAGQGLAGDFSFNWSAPAVATHSPVLGVAPAQPLLPPQYWPPQ